MGLTALHSCRIRTIVDQAITQECVPVSVDDKNDDGSTIKLKQIHIPGVVDRILYGLTQLEKELEESNGRV